MDEERKSWLDGQTLTVPVEEFINMRIELSKLEEEKHQAWRRKFELDDELEKTQAALEDAKKQIRELLGVDENA